MLNQVTIMGRLTHSPELRRTGSGIAVTSFTLAVDRDYGNKEGGEKETDFIDCVAWRHTGEFVSKYFTKGQMAVVAGRLQVRGWTDKDGNKRRTMEVLAENVYFGEGKRSNESRSSDGSNNGQSIEANTSPADSGNGGYSAPSYETSDFVMLEDDNAQLPY